MGRFKSKDISGERFGKLVAIRNTNETTKKGAYKWLCLCDCGNTTVVSIENLRKNGGTQSCGCERHIRAAVSLDEYETRKAKELSEYTDQWKYVCCSNRSKGKHTVRCVHCGIEKTVAKLSDIPDCLSCGRMEKKRTEEQRKHKVCKCCGKAFYSIKGTALYCNASCAKTAYNARHIDTVREKHRINKRLREARAKDNGKVDYSITLARLIERDNHVCVLCGRMVNESDYVYVGDTFVAGNDYPSIDHIKPLSKGGVHQWCNVQLAHRLCNSIKNNREK